MDRDKWLYLLTSIWHRMNGITAADDDAIRETPFGEWLDGRPDREMWSDEAQGLYDRLPDVVTIYRGGYETNIRGLCWSLDREIAESFPTLNGHRKPGQPLLAEARVRKQDIALIVLEADELEIVTARARVVSTSHIVARGVALGQDDK
ncbi:hypothetical protein [Paraburkholderia sp. HD33-4]|uniref:hypothetical protein n=1 Tax=Paraburkholderia sp. HD33-4 TaxID=2883242 RepID=UPI001F469E2E|nr:hypothetical protein [Paraburkholderia sp. HD33-4]